MEYHVYDYETVLVLDFSEIENTVLFRAKKLVESRALLITEIFCQDLENMVFRAVIVFFH